MRRSLYKLLQLQILIYRARMTRLSHRRWLYDYPNILAGLYFFVQLENIKPESAIFMMISKHVMLTLLKTRNN